MTKTNSLFNPLLSILLTAILLLTITFGLSGTYAANEEAEMLEMMKIILPGSESFEKEEYTGEDVNIISVYKASNGYVIETLTDGYASEISLLVGVNNSGYVTGLVVKDMHETIGLGANALTDSAFLSHFEKTKGDAQIGEGIDAISGATVTSKAIARGVNFAACFVTGADADSGATSWGD